MSLKRVFILQACHRNDCACGGDRFINDITRCVIQVGSDISALFRVLPFSYKSSIGGFRALLGQIKKKDHSDDIH